MVLVAIFKQLPHIGAILLYLRSWFDADGRPSRSTERHDCEECIAGDAQTIKWPPAKSVEKNCGREKYALEPFGRVEGAYQISVNTDIHSLNLR